MKAFKSITRQKYSALLLVGSLLINACATQNLQYQKSSQEYEEARKLILKGNTEEGIQKIRQLAEKYPEKSEYRAYLKHAQDLTLAAKLREADSLRQQHDWVAAEQAYQQALQLEPANQRTMDGMAAVQNGIRHEKLLASAQEMLANKDTTGAQNLLRAILSEDSNQQAARALFEEIEQQRINKISNPPPIKSAFSKPITLEFKDVAVKSVFEFISRAANINFTYDRELSSDQRTSIFVRNTTIEDAIDVVLKTNQLDKKILNDNTMLIYPLSRSQEYQELFVRSFYLSNTDAKRAQNLLKTVLKLKDVYIDEKLNTLVIRDTAEVIKNAEKLIASQDLAEPEVMLEVEVMEVNRNSLEALGIRYPTQAGVGVRGLTGGTAGTSPTAGQLSISELKNFNSDLGVFTITDPVLALNLLSQDTDTNLLANPRIRVKNREKAKIHVGDRIPVLTSVANATGFVSQSVTYIEVGIKLDVEPTVLLQDQVAIKVGLEVSNQTDQVRTSSGTLTYTIGTRNASTMLRLKDGETQALAGLFRDDAQTITNRVPGLGNIPLLGRLFSAKNTDNRKKEIVLLITPRILSNISPQKAIYTSFPSGIDNNRSNTRSNNRSESSNSSSSSAANSLPAVDSQQLERQKADKAFADSLAQPVNDASNPGYTAPSP